MSPRVRVIIKKCSFIGCESDSKKRPDLTYFQYPRSNYKKWIAASGNVQLNDLSTSNLCAHHHVCSRHFKMTDYRRILSPFKTHVPLKTGVVPLPYNHGRADLEGDGQPEVKEPTGCEDLGKCSKEDSKSSKITQKRLKKCAFVNCANDSRNHPEIKFYNFPHSNHKEWIAASGCPELNRLTKTNLCSKYYVCGNHFRLTDCKKILPSHKKRFSLKSGVVPLLFHHENSRLKGSSPTSQTAAEGTSQTSQPRTNISSQNSSHQHGDDSSTSNSAGLFPRDVKGKDSEETLSNLRTDQTQGTVLCPIQEQNNNRNCIRSLQFSAPKKPTPTPSSSQGDYEKSCSNIVTDSHDDDNDFFGGDEIFFESFVDDEENQMHIDDNKYDKTGDRAIERRTVSCSKQGNESEVSSKEKVQMHHGSELEPDDQEVVSDASMNVCNENCSSVQSPSLCNKEGTYSSQSTQVVEDRSVNSKDRAVGGSILSRTSSGGAAGEGGSEKQDIVATAAALAGVTTSSVVSASTSIITTGQTIPVKVPVAALVSASSMPSPSPLCLPPPVQQVVELPQQASSKLSVADVPGPSSAASGSDAPEGPTNDCSSKPQKGKKRKRCVLASPSEDDEEIKKMKNLKRKLAAAERYRLSRQKKRERDSKLESEVALLKAEVSSLKDLLLLHMACPAPLAPPVRGANPFVVAAANPVLGANPFVVAAKEPKVAAANPVVVAAEGPKVAAAKLVVVAAKGPKVAAANPVVVAAEGPKVASANPVVVAAEGPKVAAVKPVVVAAKGPKVTSATPVVVAAEGPKLAAANLVVVAAEGLKVAAAKPVVVPAEGPKVTSATPVVVAAEGPKVAASNPVVVAAEGPKLAATNPVVVAAERPKVAAMRPGQNCDAERQLKPRGRTILPSTSKPAAATYLLFTVQRKSAT